jgi:hypothetical protein
VTTAFYCVVDERYFLGAVGMLNSLRLAGHDEPVFALDCGLTAAQRRRLEPHATLVAGPTDAPPYLLKTIAPLAHPADVMVLIDADMIVTRPLTQLVERAARGGVVAFANDADRFVREWGQALELGPIRRTTYVSSGLVLLGGDEGAEVLRLLDDRQRRVEFERTFYGTDEPGYPFRYPEQDVLNAILSTRADPERVTVLDNRLAPNPPYRGLRVVDIDALRCAYRDGTEPFVVHQYVRKPWLESTYDGVYPRLLRTVLTRDGAAVRLPPACLPAHWRPGVRARLRRGLVNARDFPRWRFGDRLPRAIGRRIENRRRRRRLRSSHA